MVGLWGASGAPFLFHSSILRVPLLVLHTWLGFARSVLEVVGGRRLSASAHKKESVLAIILVFRR